MGLAGAELAPLLGSPKCLLGFVGQGRGVVNRGPGGEVSFLDDGPLLIAARRPMDRLDGLT